MKHLLVVCPVQHRETVQGYARELYGPETDGLQYLPTALGPKAGALATHYACSFEAADDEAEQIQTWNDDLPDVQVVELSTNKTVLEVITLLGLAKTGRIS